jgi:hypothetical protein
MDRLLVAASVVIPLGLALGLAIFFLVARARQERRRREAASRTITVDELLARASRQGEATHAHWSTDDLDAYGQVRPEARNELPTGILPKIEKQENKVSTSDLPETRQELN